MRIIPAVDIKDGKCVRLSQGQADQETVYSDDPVAMASHWDEEGATLIHVVDLDGAFAGRPANAGLIKKIVNSSSAIIQVGGGIRTLEAIETYIDYGVSRIVLGTVALQNPQFVTEACNKFPEKIIVGIDARDGCVAVKGWVEVTEKKAVDLALSLEPAGLAGFIFTDISRDGMLQGPNLESIYQFADTTSLPVIASGGVSRLQDISNLLALESLGVSGIIVGKALYDKTFEFRDALKLTHAG
ncbi:MAG: 1-(5-phosphoribosyl)-5-[(5-phosphoribosylamino)methylideneamino]imidazole-4-carboxamide isomerase [Nitrospinota bacterium]|nr:1-(5-phosphoribosyl)-5-[(5-phosphoribosylamino)methylideneamino]imidazole-4-carboxamide isomerase [Nitrospinota bacterium]